MSISANIIGAKKLITVSTTSDLLTAYNAARGGEVITLNTAGAAFEWTLSASKSRHGVCVVLPLAQEFNIISNGDNELNTDIVGGTLTKPSMANGTYGANLSNGVKKLRFRGGIIGMANSGIRISTACEDIIFKDMITEWVSGDVFHMVDATRVLLEGIDGRDGALSAQRIQIFNDGTLPVDGAASVIPASTTGKFDSTHTDLCQINGGSNHITLRDFDQHYAGSGPNCFGTEDSTSAHHVLFDNLNFKGIYPPGLMLYGNHVTMQNCHIGHHPSIDLGAYVCSAQVRRYRTASTNTTHPTLAPNTIQTSDLIQGGMCTFDVGEGQLLGKEVADPGIDVNLALPYLNGNAGVELPDEPDFPILPWAPSHTRPALAAYTGAPVIATTPEIGRGTPGASPNYVLGASSAAVGDWLTIGLGGTKGVALANDRTYTWKRNGTTIYTGTGNAYRVYQVQAADSGTTLTCEQVATNAYGSSAAKSSAGVVIP